MIELTDVEGTLSLHLIIVGDSSHPKSTKIQAGFQENICEGYPDVREMATRPLSPTELWMAVQQARQERKDLRKPKQLPPKRFRVAVPIDISKDVSTNGHEFPRLRFWLGLTHGS
jgi:hypothetical protein